MLYRLFDIFTNITFLSHIPLSHSYSHSYSLRTHFVRMSDQIYAMVTANQGLGVDSVSGLNTDITEFVNKLICEQGLPLPSRIFCGSFLCLDYPKGYLLMARRSLMSDTQTEWSFSTYSNYLLDKFMLPRDSAKLKHYLA